jgi:hypothetical protein
MADSRRDRLATMIHAWSEGAREIASLPEEARAAEALAVDAVLASLRDHQTMVSLAEGYLADAEGWSTLEAAPDAGELSHRRRAVVAAAYWSRYQEMLAESERVPSEVESIEQVEIMARPSRSIRREIGHDEVLYTIKLWQRGPIRLRALPAERRPYYEALIRRLYLRVSDCRSTRELATRYYGDGEYVLQLARQALQPLGEPLSSIGWIQDAACWRRYQELLDESPVHKPAVVSSSRFALWLAGQMTLRRISVAELAYRVGTVETVVRAWLNATNLPSQEYVRRLASIFGLAESQLPVQETDDVREAEEAEG